MNVTGREPGITPQEEEDLKEDVEDLINHKKKLEEMPSYKVEIVNYFIQNEVMQFGKPEEITIPEKAREKRFNDEMFAINSDVLAKDAAFRDFIVKIMIEQLKDDDTKLGKKVGLNKWTKGLVSPFQGFQIFDAFFKNLKPAYLQDMLYHEKIEVKPELKNHLLENYRTNKDNVPTFGEEKVKGGEIKDNDKILLLDDILGMGDTFTIVYSSLKKILKEQKKEKAEIVGYFVLLDLCRIDDGKYISDALKKNMGLKGAALITLDDIITIGYEKQIKYMKEGKRYGQVAITPEIKEWYNRVYHKDSLQKKIEEFVEEEEEE